MQGIDVSRVFASSVRHIVRELRRRGLGYLCAGPDGGWRVPYDGRHLESSFCRIYCAVLELQPQGFLTFEGLLSPAAASRRRLAHEGRRAR